VGTLQGRHFGVTGLFLQIKPYKGKTSDKKYGTIDL